jgi:hypothetical protein
MFFKEHFYLLGYNAVYSDENQLTLRRNISPTSSRSKNSREGNHNEAGSKRRLLLIYSLILKVKAIHSSETSIDIQLNRMRYIPEDRVLHNPRCQIFKPYVPQSVFMAVLEYCTESVQVRFFGALSNLLSG